MYDNELRGCPPQLVQRHIHEAAASTFISEACENPHNHRFVAAVGEALTSGNSHIHEVKFKTDSHETHSHEYTGRTSKAIVIGDRHEHFIKDFTAMKDGHRHQFRMATLMNNPIEE